jgi:hypothetical protein
MNKNINIPKPEELGIPSGSLDPLKTIEMEGNFYRGLGKTLHSRPKILKIGAIIFALIFFIIPGLIFLGLLVFDARNLGAESIIAGLEPIFFAILYTAVGVIIIWDNIRKPKDNNTKTKSGILIFLAVAIIIFIGLLSGEVKYKNILSRNASTQITSNPHKVYWKIYKNDNYGFELRYLSGWRTSFNFKTSFRNILIPEVKATPEFFQDISFYQGNISLNLWFQDPKLDEKPILEENFKGEPQYYQYSHYNGAPLGIFVYVFDDARYDEMAKKREIDRGMRKETIFKGLKAYKIIPLRESDYPETWATEKIEVEKDGRLFLVFFSGNKYSSDFKNFVSDFEFIR